jgi:hypothetical protein
MGKSCPRPFDFAPFERAQGKQGKWSRPLQVPSQRWKYYRKLVA